MSELTKHPSKLLGILRANGGWMSRQAIAVILRRGHLTEHSIQRLAEMAAAGLVEVRSAPGKQGSMRYEYRAIPPEDANGD